MVTSTQIQAEYVTLAEAAALSSISERSIRRLFDTGELTPYRPVRGSVRVKVVELRKYIEGTGGQVLRKGRGRYKRD